MCSPLDCLQKLVRNCDNRHNEGARPGDTEFRATARLTRGTDKGGVTVGTAEPAGKDRFWDLYSRVYDSVYTLMPYRQLLWDTYQSLDLHDGMRVLDAGCGTGNFEHFIQQKNPPSVAIDAIDFSASMLARARRKCRDFEGVSFQRADLTARLPFDDATFDRVLSINVLYALPDPDFTTSELLRVLKPDGFLAITSPAPEFAVSVLVADHFRRVRNIWGTGRRIGTVVKSAGVLGASGATQWALNSLVINRRESDGEYRSLDDEQMADLFDRHRADGVASFDVGRALVDQNIFATAVKVAAA